MKSMFLSLAILSTSIAAAPSAIAADSLDTIRAAIAKHSPDLVAQQLKSSPAAGLFHVVINGTSGYVTADGRHFIAGDLLDIAARKNLTEDIRKAERIALVTEIRDADRIVFAADNPQHSIIVFTDVDCGFCRKLHGEIAKLNELGISVSYVAFPRSGPGSDTWTKMQDVWCATDRRAQLTRAKRDEAIEKSSSCQDTPVPSHFNLGERIGVQGTPTIILEDGSLIGGYIPAEQLIVQLKQIRAESATARAAAAR